MINGNAIAKISFTNLEYGDITAIKFNACGYNSFGDIVSINGKEKFFLIIEDINIKKNEDAVDLKAKLPNSDIKKLDLVECQICYADGTVASYEGNNSVTFELDKIDNIEQLNALHKLYDKKAQFKPGIFEQGWICSDEGLKKVVKEYKISEEEDKRFKDAEQTRLKKEKKKYNNRYYSSGMYFFGFSYWSCNPN